MIPTEIELHISEYKDILRDDPGAEEYLREKVSFAGRYAFIELDGGESESESLSDITIDKLYASARHISHERASSYFMQYRTISELPASKVRNILEVGPGRGRLTALLTQSGYVVKTADVDKNTNPDVVAALPNLPFDDGEFDLTCAFQVLQHLPYPDSLKAIVELARCSNRFILLSFPDQTRSIYLKGQLRLPWGRLRRFAFKFGMFTRLPGRAVDRDTYPMGNDSHEFRAHRWELSRKSYSRSNLLSDIDKLGIRVIDSFHNPDFPFHYFVLAEKRESANS
jgi:SAM-dependent methyltransferase